MSKKAEKHLNRDELIEMAKKGSAGRSRHLAECRECSELVELFKEFDMAGRIPLRDAPEGWVERAITLAKGEKLGDKIKRFTAKLVFDSWAIPQPVGVRGKDIQRHRRIRYKSGKVVLDIHAECGQKGWVFTAYISGEKKVAAILKIGKKNLLPDKQGFYHWSSGRPPGVFYLQYEDYQIEFPRLPWKKSDMN